MFLSADNSLWWGAEPKSFGYCIILTGPHSVRNTNFSAQAMSPDGEAIVTGAGDETLRFWNVFSKMRSTKVTFPHMLMMSDLMLILLCRSSHSRLTHPALFRNPCLCWTSSPGSGSDLPSVPWGNKSRKRLDVCMCQAVNRPLLLVFTSVSYRDPPLLDYP